MGRSAPHPACYRFLVAGNCRCHGRDHMGGAKPAARLGHVFPQQPSLPFAQMHLLFHLHHLQHRVGFCLLSLPHLWLVTALSEVPFVLSLWDAATCLRLGCIAPFYICLFLLACLVRTVKFVIFSLMLAFSMFLFCCS